MVRQKIDGSKGLRVCLTDPSLLYLPFFSLLIKLKVYKEMKRNTVSWFQLDLNLLDLICIHVQYTHWHTHRRAIAVALMLGPFCLFNIIAILFISFYSKYSIFLLFKNENRHLFRWISSPSLFFTNIKDSLTFWSMRHLSSLNAFVNLIILDTQF